MSKRFAAACAAAVVAVSYAPARAEMIGNGDGGADFPQGAASFADAVVSYTAGSAGLDASISMHSASARRTSSAT